MISEIEMYWNEIDRQSPATSIIVIQDYEGIITVNVKYPGQHVIETTGHNTLWQALRAMYMQVIYPEGYPDVNE